MAKKPRTAAPSPTPPAPAATERIATDILPLAVPIDSLQLDPANLRTHGPRSIEGVAKSLERFGQTKPIVVDAAGVVIAGNGTLEAARRLGWTRLAVVRADLVGEERTAYAIADNRTAELSAWDEDALRAALGSMEPPARLAAGYTDAELAQVMDDPKRPMAEDEVPAILPGHVALPGEIWQLGHHRIMCGSSTSLEDVHRLMDGEKAALCATDPPYLVDYTGERPGNTGKDWSGTYNEVEITDAADFFRGLFAAVLEVLAPHAAIYCWHAHKRLGVIQTVWAELGIIDHQQLVWIKPSPLFGPSLYQFQHEPCVVGWREGSKPSHGNTQSSTVWIVPWDPYTTVVHAEDADVWVLDWEGKSRPVKNEHPTQKPLEIFARPIRKHTQPGALVFEPFSGSGSQLIAAHRLGRRCRAMELSPVFVDVAIRRWQNLTGEPARLLTPDGPGMTWEEARASRGLQTTPAPAAAEKAPSPRGRKKKNPPAPASADAGGDPRRALAGAGGDPGVPASH
jgi:DNA modification methylase